MQMDKQEFKDKILELNNSFDTLENYALQEALIYPLFEESGNEKEEELENERRDICLQIEICLFEYLSFMSEEPIDPNKVSEYVNDYFLSNHSIEDIDEFLPHKFDIWEFELQQ